MEPSWKPLFWMLGSVAALVALGEIFFEALLEGLEMVGEGIFLLVEGSEEHLEDKIEEWFDLDPFHAELITAWTLIPVKIALAVLVLRWLWRTASGRLWPKVKTFLHRQWAAVRLAWRLLAWPFKVLVAAVALGGLLVLL